MAEYPKAFDQMLAVWNESDPKRIRELIEEALAPDVRFVDPSIDTTGHDGFEANVHEVHERLPGAVYSRASGVDGHHDLYRYDWAIHQDGKLVLPGFDVARVNGDGKIDLVMGFFGRLPEKK